MEAVDGVSVYNYEMMSVYYIGLNMLDPALSDLRVRQALAYALDKQTIVDTVYGDTATVANDVFPDNHWSHNPDVTVYEYNPEKAKSLLEEAGYTKPASYPGNSYCPALGLGFLFLIAFRISAIR